MWKKSTYSMSNGHCLEPDGDWVKSSYSKVAWRTSSYSGTQNCAEVGQDRKVVLVRDTMDRDGPVLTFTPQAWTKFTAGIKTR